MLASELLGRRLRNDDTVFEVVALVRQIADAQVRSHGESAVARVVRIGNRLPLRNLVSHLHEGRGVKHGGGVVHREVVVNLNLVCLLTVGDVDLVVGDLGHLPSYWRAMRGESTTKSLLEGVLWVGGADLRLDVGVL